ncbi:MAG TPA: 23S rRNA (guanosine(2251)-2'-O)-methyltransferase RlmB [Mycobacteriales bacterium]|jgi:23S rRNA (guanosine2251-2'-O)-methyltransferase|nr:23S rRNA (guanosine(2251)-2'-O)-methyltransferase RlmB [Mycobacteriales bacterium]
MAPSGKGGPRRGGAGGLPKARGKGRGKDGRPAPSGSGGYGRKRLEGKGPTPPATERTGHPAARRAAAAARRADPAARRRDDGDRAHRAGGGVAGSDAEHVAGRNTVVEALRAQVPATALLVAAGLDRDKRVSEALRIAAQQRIPLLESSKPELDRLTAGAVHQGVALRVPPYGYLHPDDLLARAGDDAEPALLVALDGVTDPRNLGAVVRSAAAFGGHGVLIPTRRSAGMTAGAWKASAGAAARIPVAQATNLTRVLRDYAAAGLMVAGLAASGEVSLDEFDLATEPLVLVVGSEGSGLSRLVAQACDVRVAIPLVREVESLNAGVAAGVVLAEVARRRRIAGRP